MALPPDNKAVTGTLGDACKFGKRHAPHRRCLLGQWTQDDAFIPFTTNAAITTPVRGHRPGDPARAQPRRQDRAPLASRRCFTRGRPTVSTLTARYRRYDLDNKTPRIALPAATCGSTASGRTSRASACPTATRTTSAHATAAYDFGRVDRGRGLPVRPDGPVLPGDRAARRQNVRLRSARLRRRLARAAGHGRDGAAATSTAYEIERSEEASFLEPGAPGQPRRSLRGRVSGRHGLQPALRPGPEGPTARSHRPALAGGKATRRPLVHQAQGRLQGPQPRPHRRRQRAFTAEADYTPTSGQRLAFYTRENIATFQRGRQSGATVSVNPLDDWTSEIDDKVDSLGGGATFGLGQGQARPQADRHVPEGGRQQRLRQPRRAARRSVARRAVGGVADIPLFDDTKL